MKTIKLILVLVVFALNHAQAQQQNQTTFKNNDAMKTFVIERVIPGAGNLTAEQLKGISQTSCSVLAEMGPKIEWQQSYVTGDKVYCVYKAENMALIEEHAKKGGFPANSISEVKNVIGPITAKQ
ncbi:Protein of unknown function [Flavobacterium micromati]|uniref:DUF4242 domain-containing protein n=1 Tax=Flavobacterium micromati TaxID=229205 RepID=A0A1M5MRJ6_9FLAO|nr:DUF4242 domain-containing protein [Flavobacterium micromati]SHG80004.1 Protein of unknown function [Flavobacterium micromati]